jgi:hypothetical protein
VRKFVLHAKREVRIWPGHAGGGAEAEWLKAFQAASVAWRDPYLATLRVPSE